MRERRYTAFFKGIWKPVAALVFGGFLAGLCNGLLGAGGGIILVLVLSALLRGKGEGERSAFANALCVMLPLSVITLTRYARMGVSPWETSGATSALYLLGAIAGGVLGGILLGRAKDSSLGRLFGLLTLISGILMIVR